MIIRFTPAARNFKVGDRAIVTIACSTLHGEHIVTKITPTKIWVRWASYKTSTAYDRATGARATGDNDQGIMTLAEAQAIKAAYEAGERAPAFPGTESPLCIGDGSF